MIVRKEVVALVLLGPLPDETADEALIAIHQERLSKITRPVSDEEAALLVRLFGPDDCYGLAWTLLHLIESAPGGAPLKSEPSRSDNEWLRLLWERSHR
jgi:hypothetical protein